MGFSSHLIDTPGRRAITGCSLLALAAIGGVYFSFFPAPTPPDRLVGWAIPNEWDNYSLHWIVARGLPIALMLGAVIATVVALSWDRRRAITCLVAPLVALGMSEYIMKPLVGRAVPSGAVQGLSYPSGHITVTAAVVASAVLAVPPRWRMVALYVGMVVDVAVAVLLILLRYHYLTDIVGGVAVAIGTTLLFDVVVHLHLAGLGDAGEAELAAGRPTPERLSGSEGSVPAENPGRRVPEDLQVPEQ